jgi:hypothetical protein
MKNLRIFSSTSNYQTRFLITEYSAFSNPGKTFGHLVSAIELNPLEDGSWQVEFLAFEWALIEVYGECRFWKEESPEYLSNIYKLLARAKHIGKPVPNFPAHSIVQSPSDLEINYRDGDIHVEFNHLRMEENNMKYIIPSTALKLIDWTQEDGKFVADVVTLEEEVKIDTIYQDEDGYYLHSKRDFAMFGEKENSFIQIHGIIPTDY